MSSGLCECGCGLPAPLAPANRAPLGHVKGQPQRFIVGHNNRVRTRPPEERFWRHVVKTDSCWLWTAFIKDGYGHFRVGGRGAAMQIAAAHRFSYELLRPIPDGLVLDHLCRNRACVNPDHLEPVTDLENRRRGLTPPDGPQCINGHDYTPENTYRDPRYGKRQCRICRREASRRMRERSIKVAS